MMLFTQRYIQSCKTSGKIHVKPLQTVVAPVTHLYYIPVVRLLIPRFTGNINRLLRVLRPADFFYGCNQSRHPP